MAQTLLQNIAIKVTGKGVLSSDHLTPATGLDPAITISKNGGAFANPSAGASVMTEISDGWYFFELSTADTNTVGPLLIKATHADMDNIEKEFYVDGMMESIYASVQGIGTSGGAAINIDTVGDNAAGAISPTTTSLVGSQTNTYANTSVLDNVRHTITHATAPNVVYEFRTGGGTSPVSLTWTGYVGTQTSRIVTIYAWNYLSGNVDKWETIGTIIGQTTVGNIVKNIVLYSRHRGSSGTELGKVFLKFTGTSNNNTTINTDQVYVTYAVTSRTVGYAEGAIWIDTNNGTAGTEDFVNGVADNPCLTYANAEAIETSLGINKFHIVSASTLTINGVTNDLEYHILEGHNWVLTLQNSVSMLGAYIEGAYLSGTASGTDAFYKECDVVDFTTNRCVFSGCKLSGVITLIDQASYTMYQCVDGLPTGDLLPTIVFATQGTPGTGSAVGVRSYSGGLQVNGMHTGDSLKVDGMGRLVIDSSCHGGDIVVRGNWTVTNEAAFLSAGGTITKTAMFEANTSITTILSDTNELQTNQGNWLTATSVTVSDKAGFSLSSTGADLILKNSTFIQAIATAINEFATYGLTALNTLLVSTGIKAASIPAATLASSQHVIVDSGTVTNLTNAPSGMISVADIEASIVLAKETTVEGIPAAVMNSVVATYKGTTGSFADMLNRMSQRHAGKLIADRAAGTIEVYDTNGSSLLYTITRATVGDVDTYTRS